LLPLESLDLRRDAADRLLPIQNLVTKLGLAPDTLELFVPESLHRSLFCIAQFRTLGDGQARMSDLLVKELLFFGDGVQVSGFCFALGPVLVEIFNRTSTFRS